MILAALLVVVAAPSDDLPPTEAWKRYEACFKPALLANEGLGGGARPFEEVWREINMHCHESRLAARAKLAEAIRRDRPELNLPATDDWADQIVDDFAFKRMNAADGDRVPQTQEDEVQARANTMPAAFKDCENCPEMVRLVLPGGSSHIAVGKYELTWQEYLQSYRDGSCPLPHLPFRSRLHADDEALARMLMIRWPVTGISLDKIDCYTDWLKRKTGRAYRLPTKQEWEWFARAGATTRFPWEDEWKIDVAAVPGKYEKRLASKPPYSVMSKVQGQEVGQFPPNAFGIYDVIANVHELTSSCRNGDVRKPSETCDLVIKGVSRSEQDGGLSTERWVRPTPEMMEAGVRLVAEAD